MWDDGGIFVASAGLLPDCLFVFSLYRWGRTERQECQPYLMLLSQLRLKRGEERKHSGGTVTSHFKLMRDATLES